MYSDDLIHIGVKERSGRYRWGSGEDPYQRLQPFGDFMTTVKDLRSKGFTEAQQAEYLKMSTNQLRKEISLVNSYKEQIRMDVIRSGLKRGETNTAIADRLGMSEGSVRHLIKKMESDKLEAKKTAKEQIEEMVKKHKYVDVSESDIYLQLDISKREFNNLVKQVAEEQGYHVHRIYPRDLQNWKQRLTVTVISDEPDISEVLKNSHKIKNFEEVDIPESALRLGIERDPTPVSPNRVQVRYSEDGGSDKDGLIEIRRGTEDLDLGASRYAQVRIQVGDGHYLKGMAVYSDDLPEGVDVVFNTNKDKSVSKMDTMKKVESGMNPFGTTIQAQRGALNIVNEEGSWTEWQTKWASQFLSKQPTPLVKERAEATLKKQREEFEKLLSLENPTVKRYLMEEYAQSLDTKARELKLQASSGTRNHVILPFTDMKPNEVYAPNYNDGDIVALIRYPHAGRFEIAELTVNNKHKGAKGIIQNAKDAIGIHPSVASKLSGADFDGDTVLVIPNNDRKVKSQKSLAELKNFDPMSYKVKGLKEDEYTITKKYMNTQMGIVSNLITDMTIKGASPDELARAVKHSMVVIDSYKHKLDYKRSAKENKISQLQKDYQTYVDLDGKTRKGASTLISKSKKGTYEYYTKGHVEIDPITGKKTKVPEGMHKVKLIDFVDDAHLVSSGTAVESIYADYINKTKALKNEVIKTIQATPKQKRVKEAADQYKTEVASLNSKLKTAKLNAPRERQAQLIANHLFYNKFDKDTMSSDEVKRLKNQSVAKARQTTGAKPQRIQITNKEWEAIQKGAISHTTLVDILRNSNKESYMKLALPKQKVQVTTATANRAKAMASNGFNQAEIAKQLGLSVSTIQELVNQ